MSSDKTADAEELRRLFIEHVGVPPECRELHVVLDMLDRAIDAAVQDRKSEP